MRPYLIFFISFLTAYIFMPVLRSTAIRFGIMDMPGGRKIHKTATPLLGGVAIYAGLLIGVLFNLDSIHTLIPILTGATLILILGLANDVREISAQSRLILQILIVSIVTVTGERISFLPSGYWQDAVEVVITVLWIVGVTNAYNYLDGLDGLAAGSAIVNLLCFGTILYATGQNALVLLCIAPGAACLGFLPHNFSRKKVFLGEAGSTVLGFILAAIAVTGNWAADNVVKLAIPILILGVPIFDMIFTTAMRIKEGKVKTLVEWLRYGGKDHFHHYLVDLGFHSTGAVVFIYFITLSLGISAIMLSNDSAMEAVLSIAQASIIFGIIATLIVVGKRRRSGWT